MRLSSLIVRLRGQSVPVFGNRVYGVAEPRLLFETKASQQNESSVVGGANQLPQAFIMLDADVGTGDPFDANGQIIKETFSVVVVVSNQQDWRGQDATNQQEAIKTALLKCFMAWDFDGAEYQPCGASSDGIVYDGADYLFSNRALLYWQYRFSYSRRLTKDDGALGAPHNWHTLKSLLVQIDADKPFVKPDHLPVISQDIDIEGFADATHPSPNI
jgi:hypothetical protein